MDSRNIVLVVLASVFLLYLLAMEGIDMAGRIDYLETHWPGIIKWAEKKTWHRVLLLVAIMLLAANVWETTKEYRETPNIVVHFPSADPDAKNAEITTTKDQEIAELKRRLKSNLSFAVRIYPISHDVRPGVPKMEYVMATGKRRSPVEITAICDFPISDVSPTLLTIIGAGGPATNISRQRLEAKQFKILITSPVWSESLPLWVTVFFEGKVDRMPFCQFRVQ